MFLAAVFDYTHRFLLGSVCDYYLFCCCCCLLLLLPGHWGKRKQMCVCEKSSRLGFSSRKSVAELLSSTTAETKHEKKKWKRSDLQPVNLIRSVVGGKLPNRQMPVMWPVTVSVFATLVRKRFKECKVGIGHHYHHHHHHPHHHSKCWFNLESI